MLLLSAITLAILGQNRTPPPVIIIDHDDLTISHSCVLKAPSTPIADVNGDGVIHIIASNINVEFASDSPPLNGAEADQLPDAFAGKGIVITGNNVTLSNAKVKGYKVGIHARNADGLTIHDCDVSGNFAQRLKSTPKAEDAGDWLWPHANDDNQWIVNYGAGLCIEDSGRVTLHDIRARRTQNGVILDAVNDSKVYDCDCSFLSGWGLAMWRSSRNVICRNAFDFCVRGYSHDVYNRGQDSAGILMFEQCCENVFAENSCTHCGDGFFSFAGKEALGEAHPHDDDQWYQRRGCNDNEFIGNDFSFAAAHGLELTFSFRNRVIGNTFRSNAICGIWGGYSQALIVDHNTFAGNGEGAYGQERGGINIEHGRHNMIGRNTFKGDACGVRLWWDEDKGLLQSRWAKANEPLSADIFIVDNVFQDMPVGIELRQTTATVLTSNAFHDVARPLDADPRSAQATNEGPALDLANMTEPIVPSLGQRAPIGNRADLAGRENIIMTEWGPWDHQSPFLQFAQRFDGADEYRLLGGIATGQQPHADAYSTTPGVNVEVDGERIRVRSMADNTLVPYAVTLAADDGSPSLCIRGTLSSGFWTVWTFPSSVDPRSDAEAWRRDGEAHHHELTCADLDFAFGSRGMSEVRHLPAVLPRDHFGVIATRTLTIPKGTWRIDSTSDDGLRLWMDDQLVIDDWTWHGPTKHAHVFEIDQPREVRFRVEYFELDGAATLQVDLQPITMN